MERGDLGRYLFEIPTRPVIAGELKGSDGAASRTYEFYRAFEVDALLDELEGQILVLRARISDLYTGKVPQNYPE